MHKRVDTLPIEQVSVMVQNFYQVDSKLCQVVSFENLYLTRHSIEGLRLTTTLLDSPRTRERTSATSVRGEEGNM